MVSKNQRFKGPSLPSSSKN